MIERTPGVTRLVDRLVKKGFVERNRGAEDRRVVRCSITPAGLSLLQRLDLVVEAADEAVQRALGDDALADLVAHLDALRAELRTD